MTCLVAYYLGHISAVVGCGDMGMTQCDLILRPVVQLEYDRLYQLDNPNIIRLTFACVGEPDGVEA